MAKIIRKSNFRVVVEPKGLGDYGGIRVSDSFFGRSTEEIEKEYLQRCNEIEEEIKRHVDNVGYISVEYDTEERCSHCGYRWEVSEDDNDSDFPKGTPMCCQKAIDEYNEQKSTTNA